MMESVGDKITVKKFRKTSWLTPGHDGEIVYSKAIHRLVPQVELSTGRYITGLTKEDEERLEKALFLKPGDLSSYNKVFWSKFAVEIPKEGKVLDISNPMQELEYKMLCDHDRVAISEDQKENSPSADYVMSSINQVARVEASKFEVKEEAFDLYRKLKGHAHKIAVLKVLGKRVSSDTTEDFVKSQLGKIIEETPEKFIEVVKDPNLDTKVLIMDGVANRILKQEGGKYTLIGDAEPLGYSLNDTIDFLKDPSNQQILINIKTKLEVKNS
jgi:uncharacterized protein (UPF0335 family)